MLTQAESLGLSSSLPWANEQLSPYLHYPVSTKFLHNSVLSFFLYAFNMLSFLDKSSSALSSSSSLDEHVEAVSAIDLDNP
jgi:hypothetical protein